MPDAQQQSGTYLVFGNKQKKETTLSHADVELNASVDPKT